MAKQSDLWFGDALRELMSGRDMSFRDLARALRDADPEGRGFTHSYLNMLARGHDFPSENVMERIAAVFGVRPDYFAEYRLLRARWELDPKEVGLARALANLKRRR